MSKYEKYLAEQEELRQTLFEEVDTIMEKLGSLDAMDAHELGLPANVPIKASHIVAAFKKICAKGDCDMSSFLKKISKAFPAITPEEIDRIKMALKTPTGSGGDQWGLNPKKDFND